MFLFFWQLQNLEGVVPLERCRLVRYDEYTETLDQSFDDNPVRALSLSPSTLVYWLTTLAFPLPGVADLWTSRWWCTNLLLI